MNSDAYTVRLIIEEVARAFKAYPVDFDVISFLEYEYGDARFWDDEVITAYVAMQLAMLPQRRSLEHIHHDDVLPVLRRAWTMVVVE